MKKNAFVFICCFFMVFAMSVCHAQDTPETAETPVTEEKVDVPDRFPDYDFYETTHFKVYFMPDSTQQRPYPDETGEMLEQLWVMLDRTFGKTIFAAETRKKRELEKKNKSSDPKSGDDTQAPAVEKEKVSFLLLDDMKTLSSQLAANGLRGDRLNLGGGCYDIPTRTIYLARADNLYQTRSAMFFQAVLCYIAEHFPGTPDNYPAWFMDSLGMAFRDHLWDGKRLTVGGWPPMQTQDIDQLAIQSLEALQQFIADKKNSETAEESEPEKTDPKKLRRSKNQTPQGTEISCDWLDGFDTQNFKNAESATSKNAFCWALGKYLLSERPDAVKKILTDLVESIVSASENSSDAKNAFRGSWQKAFEKSPLTVEQIGFWIADHPSAWTVVFNEWQFTGEEFLCRTSDAALLVYENGLIPPFKVFLFDEKGTPGIVINYQDKDNYESIRLHAGGDVSHTQKINGSWGNPEILFTFPPPKKNQNFSNEESVFSVRYKGDLTEVFINNFRVFSDVTAEDLKFGMLLEGYKTEASFLPKR